MKQGMKLATAAKVLGRAGGIASGRARRAKAAARKAAAVKAKGKPAPAAKKAARGAKANQLAFF